MSGDIIFVLQVSGPEPGCPVSVTALIDKGQVMLVPTVDFITHGIELSSVGVVLPVVIPAHGQVAAQGVDRPGVLNAKPDR